MSTTMFYDPVSTALPTAADLKHYQIVTRTEFEAELSALVSEGRLSDWEEVEPERSWNRWQGERFQRKYLCHIPHLHGYLIVKSGINPQTDESNGSRLHSIRLFFRRSGQTVAQTQTNRLPRWKENLRDALSRIVAEAA
jgi:hypothetical protein